METISYAVTEEAVDSLMNFIPEIFDAHFVQDIGVRRQVCRQLLTDSTFIEFVSERFDLNEALNNGGILGRSIDTQETPKPSISISVGLKGAQKALLSNNNLDYNIVYKEGNNVPHALAYAQRVIDTARCKAAMNYRRGMVIDIGGNYATHAMTGAQRIHSCTLLDDVEEHHRQTQRDVHLEMGEYDTPSMCTEGVECCDVFATEGFSLHTLPRIDPKKIPEIFHRHGFEFLTGVHHFDPAMDSRTSGFMPDVEMHWQVVGGNDVQFFFENDSSYGYTHRLDWLKQYSHSNFFSVKHYEFVVYYVVDRIEHGMIYWSMMKLDKQTLGAQTIQPQYRYVNNEEHVTIQVPEFDPKSSFPISDPRSYKLSAVTVPAGMFSYVYKAALANDTATPHLPISLDITRNFTHTYNNVRDVNGTSITIEHRLPSQQIDMIARGIYLIVVQRSAQLRIVATEYTKMFLRIQKQWGDESYLYLLAKSFSYTAILPFVLLAENINQVVDLMTIHMRATVRSSKIIAAVTEELPYYLLSPVAEISGRAKVQFSRNVADVQSTVDVTSEDIDLMQFFDAFKDELQPQHRHIIEKKISLQREQAEKQVVDALESDTEFPEVPQNREAWDEATNFVADKVPIREDYDNKLVSQDEILKDVQFQIYESGLYNLDVGLNVVASAIERCSEMWTGTSFRDANITSRNNTTDVGIRFLRVTNGKIDPDQNATDYSVALDPNTHELLALPKEGEDMKMDTKSDYVFVYNPFKIFVNLKIAKKLTDFARFMKTTRPYKLRLIDGVPGCGKTHEIIQKMTQEDLLACAVRDTANNTKERMALLKPNVAANRMRTADSCTMHSTPRAKTLRIDEGLMLLPGVVHYLGQASRAEEIEVFGDSAQIGFIDRGSKLGLLRFPKLCEWVEIEYRNLSVRFPADVCFAIRTFYPEWRRSDIKTASPIRRSVSIEHIPETEHPAYTVAEANVRVMTITTMDKDKIANKPGFVDGKRAGEVSTSGKSVVTTVHETQGATVAHATVMRLNTFSNPIFASRPHLLVALTRHTHSLKVVSTVSATEDPMMILAKLAMSATEEQLDECQVETPDWLRENFSKVKLRGV